MGTRHLIAVYQDGVHKVAQYGQWDGYPAGQGIEVLNFLRSHDSQNLKEYYLRECRWLTDAETKQVEKTKDWTKLYPHLTRSVSAELLTLICRAGGLALVDSLDFANDSLFCEWAYVIDYDQNVFEVYKGFNKKKARGRFGSGKKNEDGYYPVTLLASFPLDDLPSDKEFLSLDQEE